MVYMPKSAKPVGYMPKSAVPVTPVQEEKFGSAIPSATQFVGSLLGGVLSGGSKQGRIAGGTAGRATGEMIRQSIDPETSSISDAAKIVQGLLQGKRIGEQILSPEEQVMAEKRLSKETAKKQLGQLGVETGVGLGSELAGEYIVGPAISKTVDVGKAGLKKTGEVLTKIFPRLSPFISGTTRELTEDATAVLGRNASRAANELYSFDKGSIVKNFNTTHSGLDLSKRAAELTKNVVGRTDDEIYKNVLSYTDDVGSRLNQSLASSPKEITLESLTPEVQKQAAKIAKAGRSGERIAADLLDEFNSMVTKNKVMDRVTANELKSTLTEQLYTASGKAKNVTPMSSGTTQAYELVSKYLREQVKDGLNKETTKLFDDYAVLKAMRTGLENKLGRVSGMPEAQFGRDFLSQVFDVATKGFRTPEYLQSVVTTPPRTITPNADVLSGILNVSRSGLKTMGAEAAKMNPQLEALQRMIDKESKSKQTTTRLP